MFFLNLYIIKIQQINCIYLLIMKIFFNIFFISIHKILDFKQIYYKKK